MDVVCSMQDMDAWGPFVVNGACGNLSFTLLFEEVVMAVIPASCALLATLARITSLFRLKSKTERTFLSALKLGAMSLLAALDLIHICVIAINATPKTRASLVTAILYFLLTSVFIYLSELEHTRTVCPSYFLCAYLSFICLLDIIRARTLWTIYNAKIVAIVFTTALILRLLVLILESWSKQHALKEPFRDSPPEMTNGLFSLLFLSWLNSLLLIGYKERLSLNNLFDLRESMKAETLLAKIVDKLVCAKEWKMQSLFTMVLIQHWDTFTAGALLRLFLIALKFTQPFLVESLLDYVSAGSEKSSARGTWLLIAYAAVYISIAVCQAGYKYQTHRLIAMVRGDLTTLLYRHIIDTDTMETSTSPSGPVTLVSIGMEKVVYSMQRIHQTWAGQIEIALAIWLLEKQIHLAVLGSVLIAILCIGAGCFVAVTAGRRQILWVDASERRINMTTSMLTQFKSIKLAGYSNILSSRILNFRDAEVDISKTFRECVVGMVILANLSIIAAPIVGFGIYVLTPSVREGRTFDSKKAFTSLAIFELLAQSTSVTIQALVEIVSAANCVDKFKQHIAGDSQDNHADKQVLESSSVNLDSGILLENSHNRSLINQPGGGTLSDMPLIYAHSVNIGWSGHDPVIKDLTFNIMKSQIAVITGSVGSGKSTLVSAILGQALVFSGTLFTTFKHAAYCSQNPWLLNQTIRDNILAGSDFEAGWYETVIDVCCLKMDIERMCIGDQSIIGSEGTRLSGGQRKRLALARAVYSKMDILILDDVFSGLDPQTTERITRGLLGPRGLLRRTQKTVILTVTGRFSCDVDTIIDLGHNTQPSQNTERSRTSPPEESGGHHLGSIDKNNFLERFSEENHQDIIQQKPKNDGSRQSDAQIYRYYISKAGRTNVTLFILYCIGAVVGMYLPQIWIALWTKANESNTGLGTNVYLGVYVGFGVFAALCLFLGGLNMMMTIVPKSARLLHRELLHTTMQAPVSFIANQDIGNIVNRFSQDLGIIDTDLPTASFLTIFNMCSCVIQTAFVCVSSRFLATTVPVFAAMLYLVQRFYLRTSRQLRNLDIEAKAPLISHFMDTITGKTTIQSYGLGKSFETRLIKLLDASQRPFYLLYCIQDWLGLVLGLFVAAMVIVLVGITIGIRGSPTAGFLGVALNSVISFSLELAELVTSWTDLETAIQALSRIKSFTANTSAESNSEEESHLPENWPSGGQIEFKNVSASYKGSASAVLVDIDLLITSGQKIGVCGRTGSGKSSLLATLTRILDVDHGSILIDGIEIKYVPHQHIRSNILNIPQEPFIIPGTIRNNMDPWDKLPNCQLTDILRKVCLWENISTKAGLDTDMNDIHLSTGQLQLLSLARVLVQQGRIVVMDEISSNLDSETDVLIQSVINECLMGRTVIIVSHNLDRLMECEKVIVIESGRVVEFEAPSSLISDPNSRFSQIFQ